MNRIGFMVTSALVALALLSSMLFVVDQRQFGVVFALGQIKEVITEPGLNFKLPPPFQNVSYIDKRLLTLESPDTEPMLRMYEEDFLAWLAARGTVGLSIALDPASDDGLIGYAAGYPQEGELYVDLVAVHPDKRSRGAGRALVRGLLRELAARHGARC